MKLTATLSLMLALSTSGLALAQSGDMKGMEMKDMDMQQCHEMMKGMKGSDMKGMDMKDMGMQQCREMMQGADQKQGKNASETTHHATAVVKNIDAANGKVTLAHEPVKSLKWPAMTMNFSVHDKALFNKLAADKKVNVEFMKKGSDYVITAVK